MAKYIVDLQEIYEDKSDIDEYLITTDTRAITNTFTRQPTVKIDTRVALNPSEKLDVSMQKIDRYLQQLKDVAFYNPLTNINTTISSEANQVFTAKVVKTFYDNYTETDARTKAMADAYGWDFPSGALKQKIADAMLKTNSAGTGLEWKKLSETTVNKANKLSVYDQYSNDVSNFTANVKDDRNAPVYIYGTTQAEPYKARPYLATNTSVKSAVSSTKASNLKMFTAAGTELSPEGLITAKEISSGNNYVEFMNNVSKVLVINSAREASSVNSGGILGGGLITFTWKGETGTPDYVFGGPSKDKVHVYQPRNFSVKHATSADSANNANHATSADEATHATSADSANNATKATSATKAENADNAAKSDYASAVPWAGVTGAPFLRYTEVSRKLSFSPKNDTVDKLAYSHDWDIPTSDINDNDKILILPLLEVYVNNPVTGLEYSTTNPTMGSIELKITTTTTQENGNVVNVYTLPYYILQKSNQYITITRPIIQQAPWWFIGRPQKFGLKITFSQKDINLGNSYIAIEIRGGIICTTLY